MNQLLDRIVVFHSRVNGASDQVPPGVVLVCRLHLPGGIQPLRHVADGVVHVPALPRPRCHPRQQPGRPPHIITLHRAIGIQLAEQLCAIIQESENI